MQTVVKASQWPSSCLIQSCNASELGLHMPVSNIHGSCKLCSSRSDGIRLFIIIMKARITVTLYIKMLQGHFTQSIAMKTRCQCGRWHGRTMIKGLLGGHPTINNGNHDNPLTPLLGCTFVEQNSGCTNNIRHDFGRSNNLNTFMFANIRDFGKLFTVKHKCV